MRCPHFPRKSDDNIISMVRFQTLGFNKGFSTSLKKCGKLKGNLLKRFVFCNGIIDYYILKIYCSSLVSKV